MRAVNTTWTFISKDDGAVYRSMTKVQDKLVTGFAEIAAKNGSPFKHPIFPRSLLAVVCIEPGIDLYSERDEAFKSYDMELQGKFATGMDQEGILTLGGEILYEYSTHNGRCQQDIGRSRKSVRKYGG